MKKYYRENPVSDSFKEKMRISATEQFKDPKQREIRSGENCPFYKDGRSSEDYQPGTRSEHLRWAKQIRKRDNHTCQLCGKPGYCAHHIDYDPDNFDEDNGICLCRSCHSETNVKDRNVWTEFFQILIHILSNKEMEKKEKIKEDLWNC